MKAIWLTVLLLGAWTSLTFAQSATYSTQYAFTDGADGYEPFGQLTLAGDGAFYGVNASGVFRLDSAGQLTVPLALASGSAYAPAMSGPDGALYISFNSAAQCGLIYRLDTAGSVSTFYQLPCDSPTTSSSISELTLGSNGNFYGFANYGNYSQYGALFQLSSVGQFSVLHAFTASDYEAKGALLQASNGTFYVVSQSGCGAIYEFDSSWSTTLLHSFTCTSDGGTPSSLIEAPDGNLYGISADSFNAFLFRLTLDGTFAVLSESPESSTFSVAPGIDGYLPPVDSSGNLYGFGDQEQGSFYQVTPTGRFASLYTLDTSDPELGFELGGSMTQGTDGAFYGTALGDNVNPHGSIYRLAVSNATAPAVQLSFTDTVVSVGESTTLNWAVSNAFSQTMQQCYALVQNNATGGGTWTGLQTGTVSDGAYIGSASITPTAAGFYTYALTCGGFESGFASISVGAKATTTTTLMTNSPVILGTVATLTATPSTSQSLGPITGSVTFTYGSEVLGTAGLLNGSASLNVEALGIPTGTYPITATYSGDENYQSSSATAKVVVLGYATVATLNVTPMQITQGQTVTLSSTVSRTSEGGAPTGSVTFFYGAQSLGQMQLNGGKASVTTPTNGSVAPGIYNLTAKYSGDQQDQAATSPVVVVNLLAATTTGLTVAPNPAPANSAATLTATVKQTYGTAVPTGTVTFSVGNYIAGTASLNGTGIGQVNLSTVGIPPGTYPLVATYSGNSANGTSRSKVVDVTIR
jgi:hypothetical protein